MMDDNVPAWLVVAKDELLLDVREVRGAKSNPRIAAYHAHTYAGDPPGGDEVPWCASFVGWCLQEAGEKSTRSKAAKSYLEWGVPLESPRIGCVAVISRAPGKYHVAFYVGKRGRSAMFLGGNQSNSVCVKAYAMNKVHAWRWTTGVAAHES